MKSKLISLVILIAIVFSCMVGCDDKNNSNNTNTNNGTSTNEETGDTSSDNESTENKDDEESANKPSKEILNAPVNSGLIQIGGEIFENGGYITLFDFMEKYGDAFEMENPERNNINAEFPENWGRIFRMYYKEDPRIWIEIDFEYPPSGSKVLGDAIVISTRPYLKSDVDYEFFIKSSHYPLEAEKSSIANDLMNGGSVSFFEKNGFEKVEATELYADYTFEIKDNINKYSVETLNDGSIYCTFIAELDKTNLYGEKPIIRAALLYHTDIGEMSFGISHIQPYDDNLLFIN